MTQSPIELLKQGFLFEPATQQDKLFSLAQRLAPVTTRYPLIRIGGDSDGGYLVPDDLSDICACFSPGVDESARFEEDIARRFGIPSHLVDFSVNGPPHGFNPKSFTKRFIGTHSDDTFITLDDWIRNCEDWERSGDFILQMDIEGAEYASLLSLQSGLLRKFRILVMEVHHLYAWANPIFFSVVEGFFNKLLADFHVVHIHPNNNDGQLQIGPFPAPRTIEMTFLRRDRSDALGACLTFPHPLDRPNSRAVDDFPLPTCWHGQKVINDDKRLDGLRVVLCRPMGGLNDVLCSIGKCWGYANQFGRKLYVDSMRSGLHDNFWHYFEPINEGGVFELNMPYSLFESAICWPAAFQGRIEKLFGVYSFEHGRYIDSESGLPTTFDFDSDYSESLLLHEQGWLGAQLFSIQLLSKLRFTEHVKQHILSRLIQLPKDFAAVHIRHTDYKTNYVDFLDTLRAPLAGKDVLICSDNLEVINVAGEILSDSKLIRISKFMVSDGNPLHIQAKEFGQFDLNIDALADLCGMALAQDVYFTNVLEAQRPSGYSLLAKALHGNRSVLMALLG